MTAGAALANVGWLAASLPEWIRFRRAAADVENEQRRILQNYLRGNAATDFGRSHQFSRLASWEAFNEAVPVRTYEDFRPWIERIADGEPDVLTADLVTLLEPSSGSSGPEKWVPYTKSLQAEYRRAVAAWMAQNFIASPGLLGGRAYWSLTPQPLRRQRRETQVPVGFDDDSAYLGGAARRLVDLTLVTRPELRRLSDTGQFRHVTLLLLLGCRDLRLISVWHPSFLSLLLEHLQQNWLALLEDLRDGYRLSDPAVEIRANPRRAQELERRGYDNPAALWPALRLISCWGDANAAGSLGEIRASFPGVIIQPKGLVATEAFVTLPFAGSRPLAIRSHFFEFLDENGAVHPSWSLNKGQRYSLVVTTAGGLYRYRLRDSVEVTDFYRQVPSLSFLGKEDNVSDHYGEKLDETFVANCLQAVFERLGLEPRFAMLALDPTASPDRYTLYLQCEGVEQAQLADQLDQELCRNPHYELCVRLGQLGKARVHVIAERAYDVYTAALIERGMRLGDIKPTPLSRFHDWSKTFP